MARAALHLFEGGKDGFILNGVAVDRNGAVYGTTSQGGTGFCVNNGVESGCGTVFQLRPAAEKGKWTEVLYSFQGGSDGYNPGGGLQIGTEDGSVFGTTAYGGVYDAGTAFEVIFP